MGFSDRFSKNIQISNLMKMRPLGAEMFHADRQTGMTKLTVAFRNSANAPKMWVRNWQINVNSRLGIMKGAMMVYH